MSSWELLDPDDLTPRPREDEEGAACPGEAYGSPEPPCVRRSAAGHAHTHSAPAGLAAGAWRRRPPAAAGLELSPPPRMRLPPSLGLPPPAARRRAGRPRANTMRETAIRGAVLEETAAAVEAEAKAAAAAAAAARPPPPPQQQQKPHRRASAGRAGDFRARYFHMLNVDAGAGSPAAAGDRNGGVEPFVPRNFRPREGNASCAAAKPLDGLAPGEDGVGLFQLEL